MLSNRELVRHNTVEHIGVLDSECLPGCLRIKTRLASSMMSGPNQAFPVLPTEDHGFGPDMCRLRLHVGVLPSPLPDHLTAGVSAAGVSPDRIGELVSL